MSNSFLYKLVYSSVFIASISGIYCFFVLDFQGISQCIMASLLTFSYYSICRIVKIKDYNSIKNQEHLSWVLSHFTEILFAVFGALLLILIWTRGHLYTHYFLAFVLAVSYLEFRKYGILKNLIIGFSWALLPYLFLDHCGQIQIEFGFYFLYFSFLSFWYDLKDTDENQVLKTIGFQNYYRLLIILSLLILVYFYCLSSVVFTGLFSVLLFGSLYCGRKNVTPLFYLFWIDLLIIVPSGLIYIRKIC